MSDLQMRPLDDRDVRSLRAVVAFTVMCHVLDLITTQFRDPLLSNEGNPFYTFIEHLGYSGWPWLVITKVLMVWLLGLGFWWYLRVRHHYLPDKIVRSPRSLIWYGMWDRKPYPKSLWGRLFNARKLKFLGVVLAGLALPASGAAALFISIDNVLAALNRPLPMPVAAQLLMVTIVITFTWWFGAYWEYYRAQVRTGMIKDRE